MIGMPPPDHGNRVTEGPAEPARSPTAPPAGTPATQQSVNPTLPGARNASNDTAPRRVTFSAPGSASAEAVGAKPPPGTTPADTPSPQGPLQPMQSMIGKQLRGGDGFEKTLADIETHSGLMANPMNRAAGMAALLENFHLVSSTDNAGPGTNARFQSYGRIFNAMIQQMQATTTDELRDALNHVDSLVPEARKQLKLGERTIYGLGQVLNPEAADLRTRTAGLEEALTAIETQADVLSEPGSRAVIMKALMENLHQIPNGDQAGPLSNPRYQCYTRLAGAMRDEAIRAANTEDPLAMPQAFISELNGLMDAARQHLKPSERTAIDERQ